MPICETIVSLAKQLEEQLPTITPTQSKMLDVLKTMPPYKQRGDLRAWSAAYKATRNKNEESDPNYSAIEAIYEIGRYNISTDFDEDGTVRLYHIATAMLAKRHIILARDVDLSRW